jgi:hypothetical protein
MVSGQDNEVELRGRLVDQSIGTSISLLSLAIADLRMNAAVPGLAGDRSLVRELVLKKLSDVQISGIPFGFVQSLSTRIRLVNPFSTSISIVGMNIRADDSAQVDESLQVATVNDSSTIQIGHSSSAAHAGHRSEDQRENDHNVFALGSAVSRCFPSVAVRFDQRDDRQ